MSLWRKLWRRPSLDRAQPGTRVVVRGRVIARDLIESPLTQQHCVYYSFLIEEWRPVSLSILRNEGVWLAVERDEAAAEFYIDDGSGRALVSPAEALVDTSGVVPDRIETGLNRRGSEWRIEPGDLVEVSGLADTVSDHLDEARSYRDGPVRLCLRSERRLRIHIRVVERPTS